MFSFFLFDGLNNFAKNSLAWIQTLPNCKTPFLCRTRQRRRLSEVINSLISSQDGNTVNWVYLTRIIPSNYQRLLDYRSWSPMGRTL